MAGSVVLIIASQYDEVAKELLASWASVGASLCAARDLSSPGWRYSLSDPKSSIAVASGTLIRSRDISGILIRRFAIAPEELPHIVPGDREYVASEMTAFLTAWLSSLSCPMVNRPAAGSLSGPAWRPEQWIQAAVRAGIPVAARRRSACRSQERLDESGESCIRTAIAAVHVFGSADERLVHYSRRLAVEANVSLLEVSFVHAAAGYRFVGANPWPDLRTPGVAGAVRDYLVRT